MKSNRKFLLCFFKHIFILLSHTNYVENSSILIRKKKLSFQGFCFIYSIMYVYVNLGTYNPVGKGCRPFQKTSYTYWDSFEYICFGRETELMIFADSWLFCICVFFYKINLIFAAQLKTCLHLTFQFFVVCSFDRIRFYIRIPEVFTKNWSDLIWILLKKGRAVSQ